MRITKGGLEFNGGKAFKTIELLLDQLEKESEIMKTIIKTAVGNDRFGEKVMKLLRGTLPTTLVGAG